MRTVNVLACYKLLPGCAQISNEINVIGYVQLNRTNRKINYLQQLRLYLSVRIQYGELFTSWRFMFYHNRCYQVSHIKRIHKHGLHYKEFKIINESNNT